MDIKLYIIINFINIIKTIIIGLESIFFLLILNMILISTFYTWILHLDKFNI